ELDMHFVFDRAQYDYRTIACLAERFQAVLENLVDSPGVEVTGIGMLTEPELARLREWNGPAVPHLDHISVPELIGRQARRTPDAIAVVCEGRELTYGTLNERANQLAHLLRSHGVGPEVPVGLCVERGVDLIVALLGILKSGGAYVP